MLLSKINLLCLLNFLLWSSFICKMLYVCSKVVNLYFFCLQECTLSKIIYRSKVDNPVFSCTQFASGCLLQPVCSIFCIQLLCLILPCPAVNTRVVRTFCWKSVQNYFKWHFCLCCFKTLAATKGHLLEIIFDFGFYTGVNSCKVEDLMSSMNFKWLFYCW